MLFPDNKVEIKLNVYKEHAMAVLIATRLHLFANDKELSPDYHKLGFRFIVSDSGNKTELFIASNKLRALDDGTVEVFKQLAKTYQAILEPFFSKR